MRAGETMFRMTLRLYAQFLPDEAGTAIVARLESLQPFTPEERAAWVEQMRPWATERGCWDLLMKGLNA